MIDFQSSESHLLLNPRLPEGERYRLEELASGAPQLPGHVWIATSGTTGALRLVALSKQAILASAAAVNKHLQSTAADVWCCVLPTFHVGGLGIHARALLSGARVVSMTWDARQFAETLSNQNVTLSALVPAQVRDLVAQKIAAPPSIRAIVIGGGAFAEDLCAAARDLRWPVLPSYGMTEACSQIATAELGGDGDMHLLQHVEVRTESDERLAIRGPSLLTGYATFDDAGSAVFADPKVGGWFISDDRGEIDGRELRVSGRTAEFVKVGGESVDLRRLDAILDSLRGNVDAAVFAVADERLGHVIHIAVAVYEAEKIVAAFHARVLPFERARDVHRVESIPRSALGKLLRSKLVAEVE